MTSYGRFIDEQSGRIVDVTKNLGRLARELKGFSTEDASIIDDFIAGSRAMQGYDMGSMGKPPELMSASDKLSMAWKMRSALKYLTAKYASPIADYAKAIHDPWLRRLMENLFMPEVPVWFVFALLGMVSDGQMALLKGGCRGFVLPMEKRFKELGGEVTYKATVQEILVENDRAMGVRLADGSVHRADIIVSAADGYSTIFKMLGGRYADEKIKSRYEKWKLIRPIVLVSFGVAREFKGEPHMSLIALKDPVAVGAKAITGVSLRILNYGPEFAPRGKTVVQVMFETDWDYWNELHNDKSSYEAEKRRVADEVLKHLKAYYSGISSQVEMTDVATPYTTWHYTMNHKGAYMGWLPTVEVIMTRMERTLPGLSNFYMAGQWIVAGGGVPPSLYSGRHLVQILCHQDKKPFVTTTK